MTNRHKDAINFVKRLTHFLLGNVFTQALAAVTGLFLVRWMSVEQYAVYTIASVVTGAVTVLSKGGTNVGFVSILGRDWSDHSRLSSAIAALTKARWTLFLYLLPLVLILASYLLYQNSVDLLPSILILALLALFWIGEMNSKTVDQVLFFAHQTTRVQMLDSALAVLRFALTAGLYFTGILSAVSALAVITLLALLRIYPISTWVFRIIPRPTRPAEPEVLKEIMVGVRRQLPTAGFYVMQGQIVLLLLSLHAGPAVIAGYGAMQRIMALFAPARVLNMAFCVPIAAKAKRHVGRTILLLTCANALPGLAMIAFALLFPNAVLWLIGPNYAHLEAEMYIMVLTTAFTLTGSAFWNLVAHRGWVKYSLAQIPLGLLWMVGGGYILDLSTITGALILSAGFTLPSIIIGALEMYLHRERPALAA